MAKVVTYFTARGKSIVAFAQPKLSTAWRYAKAEMGPPSIKDLPEVQAGFNKLIVAARTQQWKKLTVKEAWLNTLIGAEIAFWFFAGECIGKGSVIGYNIPGAVNFDIHF
ncbi:ATP synthase subunit g, mitochondrial-like [Physella acuta]|uniref:ATP synthase subunit g, mitochondrial-like n=1 Tax=Physella acuta TaxID=109671 RepID=UPI0027DBD846|nr:ATP synthase subunit g, mitochondrial-like [Physella acuta]